MQNQSPKDYYLTLKKQGYSESQIRDYFRRYGYTDQQIASFSGGGAPTPSYSPYEQAGELAKEGAPSERIKAKVGQQFMQNPYPESMEKVKKISMAVVIGISSIFVLIIGALYMWAYSS